MEAKRITYRSWVKVGNIAYATACLAMLVQVARLVWLGVDKVHIGYWLMAACVALLAIASFAAASAVRPRFNDPVDEEH